jgi:uncharacterized membrane protein (DUF485 family)
MRVTRLSIGFLCAFALIWFVARFVIILLLAHNIGTGWLHATLKSVSLDTLATVVFLYIISTIWVRIAEHRAKKEQESATRNR